MRTNLMLSAALTVVLTSAQTLQYDRTGDHMASYGAATSTPAPSHARATRHHERVHAVSTRQVPLDRTSDHMFYYGPIAQ